MAGSVDNVAHTVNLSSILRAQYSGAKLALPIDGGLYARLKHVQGIPSGGSGGFSFTKLQMIDLMVERLVRLRGGPVEMPQNVSAEELDAAVTRLGDQLTEALRAGRAAGHSFTAGIVEPGLLFSLVA